jgi:hypothetical protein
VRVHHTDAKKDAATSSPQQRSDAGTNRRSGIERLHVDCDSAVCPTQATCTSAIVKNVIIVEIKKGSTRKNIATIIVRR